MRVVLFGLLVGLLPGAMPLPESFRQNFAPQQVPVVHTFGQLPSGSNPRGRPSNTEFYSRDSPSFTLRKTGSNPRQRPNPYRMRDRQAGDQTHYYRGSGSEPGLIDRSNVHAHPFDSFTNLITFKDAGFSETEYRPLREAVEHIPIEGEMNILLKQASEDAYDVTPFSRGSVEAFPAPLPPYPTTDLDTNSIVYSASTDYVGAPLIGYRGDIESRPFSPNLNPLLYFRGSSNFDSIWEQDVTRYEATPYNSWNPVVPFRDAGIDEKIVCYFESWAVKRPKPVDFDIKDIDPFACTHLIYSFAGVDKTTYKIKALDPERDVIQGAYKSAVALKARNPELKVLIAVGGWAEGGRQYSEMVSTQQTRDAFVESVVTFVEDHRFDGIDIDWEYPGATDRGGKQTDKANIALLCEQLQAIFKQRGWILSMAVPIAKARIDEGYDIPRLSQALDFFNLMAYDLRGYWDGYADHHAPIAPRKTDKYIHKGLNLVDGLQLFVDHGAPKYKLIVGVPFYGRTFTLKNQTITSPSSRSNGVGKAGKYTQEEGYIAYYEICINQRNGGWKIKNDELGGPYMFKEDQWIGYDDDEYIEQKVNFIKNEKFGGVMLWAIDLDDYLGMCGTRWPLLSAIQRVLHAPMTSVYTEMITQSPSETVTTKITTTRVTPDSQTVPESGDTSAGATFGASAPKAGDSCSGNSMIRKYGDCSGFLSCNQGAHIETSCAPGLHWNDDKKLCDWPDSANCNPTAGVAPSPGAPPPSPATPSPYPVQPDPGYPPPGQPSPGYPSPGQPGSVSLEKPPQAGPLSGDYMVVCYFTNWAWYRSGVGKYKPEDIDPTICTHVVYGFAVLDSSTLLIKPHDSWADIDNKFYEQVTELRSKGIKVLIAIGGWNDSEGDKYSRLVNNPAARAKFTSHVVDFIKQYNFDGLDLDWEYPVCWQVNCNKGPASDKQAFSEWVKELRMAFIPHNLLLSAAVSPSKKVIDAGYDVPTLNRYLDWIAVMTYDFHGHWDKKTGHVAPLYYHPEADYDYFNADYAIRYWIEKGATKKKIVMGMPMYGQAFTLNDPGVNGLNSPASTKGKAGQFTKAAGFLAYYEICQHVNNGWTVVKDPEGRMGPYAYQGNQWVSYDDVDTIRRKSQYVRDMGLAGGMVWALDLDDFRNVCGQGKHPLMKTIQSILGPASITVPQIAGPVAPVVPQPGPPPSSGVVATGHQIGDYAPQADPGDYKVVCYFTNWAWYRQGEGKFLPEDIDPELCTHINYGFVVLDGNTLLLKPHDSWADVDNKFYSRVVAFRQKGIKVLVALGGWNDSKGDKYSRLANNPAARKKFNDHALDFIQKWGFDGLDLDWEYPKCWQVDCEAGPASDKAAFSDWVEELHYLFKPHGLLVTAAVSPSFKVIAAGYDVPKVSRFLDFINVMTYDYFGHWDKKTGHVSPMYAHPEVEETRFNSDYTIKHWIELGADPKKLIMGMPMYGQSFSLGWSSSGTGLNEPAGRGGQAGPYTRASGFLAYYEICYFIQNSGWEVVRDPHGAMGPYAFKSKQWVGFDDIAQIRHKSEYVKSMGLGGAMIWALDLDDFRNRCQCETYPLLKTINRVLGRYTSPDPQCPLLGGGALPEPPSLPQPGPQPIPQPEPQPVPLPAPYPEPQPAPYPEPQPAPYPDVQPVPYPDPQPLPYPEPVPVIPLPQPIPPSDGSVGIAGDTCVNGDFRRHSQCGKFYECYEETLREVTCFPGYHWDGVRRCVPPGQTNCQDVRVSVGAPVVSVVRPDPVIPVIPTVPVRPDIYPGVIKEDVVGSEFGEAGAPCKGSEFKRHATDCDKFFECLHGKQNPRECFPGLHWNGEGRCTWPHDAHCQTQGSVSTPEKTTYAWSITTPTTQRPSHTTTRWTTSATTRRPTTVYPYTTRPTTRRTTTRRTTSPAKTTKKSTVWYVPWTPSTEATTPAWTHAPGSLETEGYKVVCYFTNWAWYRQGAGKYRPEDIDWQLCTHIIYGFAVLDGSNLVIKPHDTWADFDNKFYQLVTSFKRYGIRVLIAIGGWNDSRGDKYSKLVNNRASRKKFTEHVVQFIEKYNFDGLDLDWEYPVCWQVNCKKGPLSDKDGFSDWMRELKQEFSSRNWLLTAAISPSEKVINLGYNVPDLTRYLDFVNVMTYDYHGHWDKKTGHVAPLYHHPESDAPEFNANYTIHYLIAHGADRRKLIMGMPMYGQAFSIKDTANRGLNSPADKGQAGRFTRAAGFLAYYEICKNVLDDGFSVVQDPESRIGPYANKGNQWVGFDDAAQIRRKSEYIKSMGLGGGMIWALDLDDFSNQCNCEPHPLLRTINRVLRDYPEISTDCAVKK